MSEPLQRFAVQLAQGAISLGPPVMADKQLVAPLPARLAHDLAPGEDAFEVIDRHGRRGYAAPVAHALCFAPSD